MQLQPKMAWSSVRIALMKHAWEICEEELNPDAKARHNMWIRHANNKDVAIADALDFNFGWREASLADLDELKYADDVENWLEIMSGERWGSLVRKVRYSSVDYWKLTEKGIKSNYPVEEG